MTYKRPQNTIKRNLTTVEEFLVNANPSRRDDKGKSGMGNVIYPGTQLGFDIGQIRDFVKVQKRSKGFDLLCPANATTDFDLDISGDAVFFLGLNFGYADPSQAFNTSGKLLFNEEQLFANNNGFFLCPLLNPNKDLEFYPYPRPMSGSDSVVLSIKNISVNAITVFVNTYYI